MIRFLQQRGCSSIRLSRTPVRITLSQATSSLPELIESGEIWRAEISRRFRQGRCDWRRRAVWVGRRAKAARCNPIRRGIVAAKTTGRKQVERFGKRGYGDDGLTRDRTWPSQDHRRRRRSINQIVLPSSRAPSLAQRPRHTPRRRTHTCMSMRIERRVARG